MADLTIAVGEQTLSATWTDENPETRQVVADTLPIAGEATRWGDELYVETPVDATPATTREEVPVGAVAYWPAGNAFCLFWGPTPASRGDEPRAAAPVGVVARVEDVSPLTAVDGNARMRIERA